MKKIPTLFVKKFDENNNYQGVINEITPGMEEVLENGAPTLKVDGSCCCILDGTFYKRYDAKRGKTPPEGAIPCCEPDPITGHHPHWLKVCEDKKEDKWFVAARNNYLASGGELVDGTYEAIGPHFQGNPYKLEKDTLVRHGMTEIKLKERTFEAIREYLRTNDIEGIVFWYNNIPQCKIKRTDFGFPWNGNTKKVRNQKHMTAMFTYQGDNAPMAMAEIESQLKGQGINYDPNSITVIEEKPIDSSEKEDDWFDDYLFTISVAILDTDSSKLREKLANIHEFELEIC